MPKIAYTTWTSPDRLSKSYLIRTDGTLQKVSGVKFWRGRAQRSEIDRPTVTGVLKDLATQIATLDGHMALGLGVPIGGVTSVEITTKAAVDIGEQGEAVPRDEEHFEFAPGPSLLLLDVDGAVGGRAMLVRLAPMLKRVATLTVPSASGRVERDGVPVGQGEHVYVVCDTAGRQQEILAALMRLAWKAGQGSVMVSKSGALLRRGPFDAAVGQASRLIYDGTPTVRPPLTVATTPGRIEGKEMLPVEAFLTWAASEIDEAGYEALFRQKCLEPWVKPAQAQARQDFIERHQEMFERRGLSKAKAARRVKLVDAGIRQAGRRLGPPVYILPGEYELVDAKGQTFVVNDVIERPESYAGKALADPFEGPDYGTTTAVIFPDRKRPGECFIWSHAHGGCAYRLTRGEAYPDDEEFTLDVPIEWNFFRGHGPDHTFIDVRSGQSWTVGGIEGHLPKVPGLTPAGRPKLVTAIGWLDRHRPVHAITWFPGKPKVLMNLRIAGSALCPEPGYHMFNAYVPPARPKGDARMAARWVEHGRWLFGDEFEHLADCFAQRVQRPWEKINHCCVLVGDQGIGKDTLIAPVIEAVGSWNTAEASPSELIGSFNPFRKAVILRLNEAHDLGEAKAWAINDAAKVLHAAPPDVLWVNEKHQKPYPIPNVVFTIYTTNHGSSGLYLEASDRRYYVASSARTEADGKAKAAEGYFNGLWRWLVHEGGMGHVAVWLRERDLSRFDAKAPPEKTPGFWAFVDANRPAEQSALEDAIDTLCIEFKAVRNALVFCKNDLVQATGDHELQKMLLDKSSTKKLPILLSRLGFAAVRNPNQAEGLWSVRIPTLGGGASKQMRMAFYGPVNMPFRDAHEVIYGRLQAEKDVDQ